MLFASVSVTVQDADGKAVLLDSTTTTRRNGDPVYHSEANENGIYTVLDDNYQKTLANCSEQFIFSGYKGGKKLLRQASLLPQIAATYRSPAARKRLPHNNR